MSTLTQPLQPISGKDCDRHLRRSWRHCQHWRQNNQQPLLCWWHWWLGRKERRTSKFSWAFWQSLHSLQHGDQCWEDQADDKHQWHQHTDQSDRTEAWDSHKLQLPRFSYNWWGFQAWDTLQDSTYNIDKAETSLEWKEYFSQLQDTTDALPCHIHLPVCMWIMDPHSWALKKNTSHGNEALPQDTTHLIQRPCYQWGSPRQDPAGNRTTRRPLDDRKETQTEVVLSSLPFIRSGHNHLARHSERGKKTKQTEEEVGRQHQEMDRPGVRQVPEGSGEQGKMEKIGCKIICGAPMTLAVKGLMMIITYHPVLITWFHRGNVWPKPTAPQPCSSCQVVMRVREAESHPPLKAVHSMLPHH